MKISTRSAKASDGFSNGEIESFLESLLASLSREHSQNSGDAAHKSNLEINKPVLLDFTVRNIKTSEIPDIERFKEIMERCNKLSHKISNDKREHEFLEVANKVISEDEVRVLSISDYNTTGVGGDFKAGGAFYTLAKTSGVTSKENVHSGGSFGIGKMSAFAASKLRTVFYSSMYESVDKHKFYCMGRAFLRTWEDKENSDEFIDREFFWGAGKNNDQAETDPKKLPKWLQRDKVGLSTHILGLQDEFGDEWELELFAVLLKNFYAAISEGIIEFTINGGQETLNTKNLSATFDKVSKAREEKGIKDIDFDIAKTFLKVISGEAIKREFTVKGVGDLKLEVAVKDIQTPKKVKIIRNGMVITDNLKGFRDELRMFQGLKPFAAVLRPAKIKSDASAWIKSLEGPRHDSLSSSYLNDNAKKIEAEKLMYEITSNVRTILKEIASNSGGETKQLTEVDKYITSKPSELDGSGENKEQDPLKIKTKIKVKKAKQNSKGYQPGGNKGKKTVNGNGNSNGGGGGNNGGTKGGKFEEIVLNARTIKFDSSQPKLRRIHIQNSPADGEAMVYLAKIPRAGDPEIISFELKSKFDATVVNNTVSFKITKGSDIQFELEIEEDIDALHAVVTIKEPKQSLFKKLQGKK